MGMEGKIISYHVYVTPSPTVSGYEGTRKTAHNARRLVRALERARFTPSVQVSKERDGVSWCEQVIL